MRVNKGKSGPTVREVVSHQTVSFNRPDAPADGRKPFNENARPAQGQRAAVPPGLAELQARHGHTAPPVQAPTQKSVSELDPTYTPIGLPSRFMFSKFKSLSVQTLRGLHISKLHRAHKENSLRLIVEAIGSTLEPGVSAFDMTPADFYYLMYWQRVSSYPKTPLLVEVLCDDKDHQMAVIEGKRGEDGELLKDEHNKVIKLDKETLTIKEFVNMTTLKVTDAEEQDLSRFVELDEKYGLGYETMRDVVEVSERVIESEDGAPEFAYQAGKASFLEQRPGFESLAARCKLIEQMTPDEILLLDEYIEAVTNFGVSEFTNLRCKECGASTRVNISFDALTFLSVG